MFQMQNDVYFWKWVKLKILRSTTAIEGYKRILILICKY